LVFQSRILRAAMDVTSGLGPYTIPRLDLDSGTFPVWPRTGTPTFSAHKFAADGALYFIRRPYIRHMTHQSVAVVVEYCLHAIPPASGHLSILYFFTLTLTGKPLIDARGANRQEMDVRRLMIWGNLIDADRRPGATPRRRRQSATCPKSWELVRKTPDGTEHTVARRRVVFDLCRDGSLVYTTAVPSTVLIHTVATETSPGDHLIEQVIALD